MFIIYGRKSTIIRTDTYHQHACSNCKTMELDIAVYRDYFHVFYIPLFPSSPKDVRAWCRLCGEPKWVSGMQQQFEKQSRTPFWFYTGAAIIAGLVAWLVIVSINNQKEDALMVADPQAGDVYTMKTPEKSEYYFLRVSEVKGDTVLVHHSNLVYSRSVDRLDPKDFFVKNDVYALTRQQLKTMLDDAEINAVDRGHTDGGISRVQ